MTNEYYYVHNPSNADKSNSVHGYDSPFQKAGSDETWLLTYINGYTPIGGIFEYHVDKQEVFAGRVRVTTNKIPDPFAIEDLKKRGGTIIDVLWLSLDATPADRVTMHKFLDVGLHLLELGDFPAARHEINSLAVDTVFTAARKTGLLASIDAVLDDYPHLK